jgi:hypothetical protein
MTYYSASDWQQSSSPMVSRNAHIEANDDTSILWPMGGTFDTLTDGEHPVLAIGRRANRPANATGVVIGYNSDTEIAVLNVADKVVVRAYVANINGYAVGAANSWQNTVYPGDPVYVDDSDDLSTLDTGCTLSFSDLNEDDEANPLAGYVWWCQDEYEDQGVGGANTTQGINQPAEDDTSERLTLCVMLTNEFGNAETVQ